MIIISIDLGVKNLGLVIQERNDSKNCNDSLTRPTTRHTISCSLLSIRDHKHLSLCKETSNLVVSILDNAFKTLLQEPTHVIIEQQVIPNPSMKSMEGFIYCYFTLRYPKANIIGIHPKAKYTAYNLKSSKMTYAQRKTWSVKKMSEIMIESKDNNGILLIDKIKLDHEKSRSTKLTKSKKVKLDDIADSYLQIEAAEKYDLLTKHGSTNELRSTTRI